MPRHTNAQRVARAAGRLTLPSPRWLTQTQQAYRRVPARYLLLGWLAALAFVAAATSSISGPVATTVGVTVGIGVAVHALLRHPALIATLLILTVGIITAAPIGRLYAVAATAGAFVDIPTAILTLTVTYLLATLLAYRTTRGRPWVTVGLVVAGVSVVGPFLTLIYPPFGFGWAWALTALILWLRGGGWAWGVEQRHRLATSYKDNADAQERTAARTAACHRTATLLSGLPDTYTVLVDRRDPVFGHHVDHLVIGPTGLTVITSHAFKGRLTDDPALGLTHPNVDVGQLLNDTDVLASTVGTRMNLTHVPVRTFTVFHDTVLTAPVSRIGLEAEDGSPLGAVTLVAPDRLLSHLTNADEVLTTRQVAHTRARLDRLCRPARTRTDGRVSHVSTFQVVMDPDGNRTPHDTPRVPTPMFATSTTTFDTHPGMAVSVLTDQGVYDGYEVTGTPVTNADGLIVVPLRDTTLTDALPETEDLTVWMPFDSIQPLNHTS